MSFYQAVAENGTGYCKGPNKLVDPDMSLAGIVHCDLQRLDTRIDLFPLLRPVTADRIATVLAPAGHAVRPVDARRQMFEYAVDVTVVEGTVEAHQHLAPVRHPTISAVSTTA